MKEPSLNVKLRKLFGKDRLYTVQQLAKLTNEPESYVRVCISRLKNPKYCGKREPLDLVIDIGIDDRVKRWGMRGATEHFSK